MIDIQNLYSNTTNACHETNDAFAPAAENTVTSDDQTNHTKRMPISNFLVRKITHLTPSTEASNRMSNNATNVLTRKLHQPNNKKGANQQLSHEGNTKINRINRAIQSKITSNRISI